MPGSKVGREITTKSFLIKKTGVYKKVKEWEWREGRPDYYSGTQRSVEEDEERKRGRTRPDTSRSMIEPGGKRYNIVGCVPANGVG